MKKLESAVIVKGEKGVYAYLRFTQKRFDIDLSDETMKGLWKKIEYRVGKRRTRR